MTPAELIAQANVLFWACADNVTKGAIHDRARELRAQAEAMNNGAAPNAGRAHENLGAAGSATADAAPPDLAARVARLEGLLRVLIDEAENMANDYHPRYTRVDEAIESARAALAEGK